MRNKGEGVRGRNKIESISIFQVKLEITLYHRFFSTVMN